MFDHVTPGHEPGMLYDCPGCENQCYCAELGTECVGCTE